MKLSYLLKLATVSLVLGFLPLHSAFADCGCAEKEKTNSNDVQTNSNAETQQEPREEDQIL